MDNSELSNRTLGFKRPELRLRYNVSEVIEDHLHQISERATKSFVNQSMIRCSEPAGFFLNAGAGKYRIYHKYLEEITLDIFCLPILGARYPVCGSIESLPLKDKCLSAVICVGEVLAYCEPARAIAEFARVLKDDGVLVVDFEATNSARFWFKPTRRRLADICEEEYNGANERVWVYKAEYIKQILIDNNFNVLRDLSTHRWSALALRAGFSYSLAAKVQDKLGWIWLPLNWGSLRMISAWRRKDEI